MMNPTVQAQGSLTANQSSFTTAAVSLLPADTLVLLFVTNAERSGGAAQSEPTVTGANVPWRVVDSSAFGANGNQRLTCLRAAIAPSAGPLTIDFGAEIQSFCAWTAVSYDGVDIYGAAGGIANQRHASGKDVDILSVSLPVSGAAAATAVAAAIALSDSPGEIQSTDPFSNVPFTSVHANTATGGRAFLETYVSANAMVPKKEWEWKTKVDAAAIAVEILADPADILHAELAQLAGTFEPILRLHDAEQWLPVSAITFGSAANAWHFPVPNSAQDDSNYWEGAPGLPFPRVPQAPSTFVPGPDWFLELGGWMDDNMSAVAGVTGPGQNPYANAVEIRAQAGGLYGQGPGAFAGTSPWYHFEFFNTSQLEQLTLDATGEQRDPSTGPMPNTNPDLSAIVASIPNAMLLCYYFFFPYHAQACSSATGAACGTVQSSMLASHAGDWQCLAILLSGPGDFPTSATDPVPPTLPPPVFIGLTGLRPAQDDIGGGHMDYPPSSFDDENRIVMKVDRYTSTMTINLDGHAKPVVYVANGTHSLYVDSGAHPTDPFLEGTQPQSCGKYDDPAAAPADGSSDLGPAAGISSLALLAKCFLVPFGFLWCASELGIFDNGTNLGDSGRTNVNGPDPVTSDSDQTADGGVVIAPGWMTQGGFGQLLAKALSVDETRLRPWAGEPLPAAETYGGPGNPNMIVDRARQAWWPVENQPRYPGAFDGHWGQCVTTDPYGRRSGPRFPPFWKMFLLALEDGKTKGLFT